MSVFTGIFLSYYKSPSSLETEKNIWIKKGNSFSQIAQQLAEEGVITHPLWFEAHLRMRGLAPHVRAGEFTFRPQMSPADIAEVLIHGAFVQHAFTLPEGLRAKEARHLLSQESQMDVSVLPDIKEGEVLPETYFFTKNEPAAAVVERMKKSMQQTLDATWEKHKQQSILKSKEELLILASVVEKEAGLATERAKVAAVFLNRLKKGMLLQSDPTVLYGLMVEHNTEKNTLSKADLKLPSPYNTYLNPGLPPMPICNPGKASIEAVMQPTQTDALYFVADGTGGHVFSSTYEEHKINHQKWRKIRDKG